MNNVQEMIARFQGFMQNPSQILAQRGLTPEALRDPRAAMQQALNSGKISQQQLISMQQAAHQIMQNPLFAQLFKR